ncbi:IPT/TIG domain-containing protein [Hymenobacter properus]|uniref:IPT/TIG domain-containing protein n=1 Tax=Hymenobacter properus TaxID=2791026 RepID=A0A931FML9_9BACT|nr:IPT/TIG domain-containing protein [Hymenobacter properus]MBF9144120.1 IPT/TIG domain-containing protein [Hymenobacter properus]MBR7722936.1 IPT/TIG domain-containing protein [Microvirga sp. SRT04]
MKQFFAARLLKCLMFLACLWPLVGSAAPFTPGNIVVVRVGDGTTVTASGAAAATFLLEYTPAGVLVQTIALPTAAAGTNSILTNTASSSSDALMTRSANGAYLVLTGYDAAVGTTGLTNTASTANNRVIARIAPDGTFDTSTRISDAFSGTSSSTANIRSAATQDGTSFYAVGSNTGVRLVPFGNSATAATTAISTSAPTNIRGVNIFGGNLYVSAASGAFQGIAQVGTGLPTTSGQTITALPGFPTATGPSPYGFYAADLSTTVPGIDVIYIADDRTATDGGIQKWSLVGGTWAFNGSMAASPAVAIRGLDGNTTSTGVSLVASGNGGIYFVTDNTGYNVAPPTTPLTAVVPAPGSNAVFRGVAFAPVAATAAPTITSFTPTSGATGATVTITGTNLTGATAVTLNGVAITGFTVVNGTTITFTVPTGATSGTIAVTTPGGTATSTGTFTVSAPVAAPTITSLSPATATAGGAAFTLTVTGTGFVSGSVVNFGSTALTTTFVSATSLTAAVPASAIATAGTYNVTVVNPAASGGTSAASTFTVTAAVAAPTITSFTPTSGAAGATVTITGTNFTGATAVTLNGVAITGFTVVNATTITFTVPATGATSGTIAVTTPGGTATSTGTFTVTPAAVTPTITQLSPGVQVVGGAPLTVTVTGTGFTPTSTVNFNGVSYAQTTSTATTIEAVIPTSAFTTAGSFPVTVTNSAGTSNAFTLTVNNPSTAGAFEDFESGTKTGYAAGTVTLTSGTWTFSDALIGNAFNDRANGLKSARIRVGFIRMDFDKPNGAGTVIVNAGTFGTDTGATFILEKSTDGGTTFTTVPGAPATLTNTITPYTFTVNQAGNVRFRITSTATATTQRINIDDISISNYTAPAAPTITSFTPTTGGPATTVTVTGTNFTGATAVTIGGFTVTNFTVVNATTITFVVPGGTGSVNGRISVTTPGGTVTSTGTFNLVSAVAASQAMPGLTAFPNPATDRVTLTLPATGAATVALRDLAGRLVLAPTTLGADKQVLLPAGLAAGVYVLEVRQGEVFAVRRIVKN